MRDARKGDERARVVVVVVARAQALTKAMCVRPVWNVLSAWKSDASGAIHTGLRARARARRSVPRV